MAREADTYRANSTHGASPAIARRILDRLTWKAVRSKSGRMGIPGYRKVSCTGPRPRFGGVAPAYPVAAHPVPTKLAKPRKRVVVTPTGRINPPGPEMQEFPEAKAARLRASRAKPKA
jgi:hypothetical protein